MSNSNSKNNPIVIPNANGVNRTIQIVTMIGSNGELIDFTNGAINVSDKGYVSDENSSEAPLAADDTFFGSAIDILDKGIVFVNVYSDVASATDGLVIWQSSNGINWRHDDMYTVPAGQGKNYAINPYARYLKVDYKNGALPQTVFELQTLYKPNSLPSSHRIQDTISTDDDARLVKAIISADSGDGQTFKNVGLQHPLSVDGDSIYEKDIDQDLSTSVGWTGGDVIDLFNDRSTVLINSTATNPKVINIELKRPVQANIFGFTTLSGNFKNTKITATVGQGVGAISTVLLDESTDSNDKTILIPPIPPTTFTALKIEFYTADACSLSTVAVSKALQRISRLQGVAPSGIVKDVAVTEDGNLSISDNSNGLAIARGDVGDTTFVHKFGNAPDFDNADGFVTVWDGANDADVAVMKYIYSTSNAIGFISSSDNGDTQDVEVQGLYDDGSGVWLLHIQTVSLTGQTKASLSQPLIRVFRMKNIGSTDIAGVVYCYEDDTPSGGIPPNTDRIRAVINGDNNQTLMALYTVPSGKTAYMRNWFASTAGANRATNYVIDVKARPDGGVFQLKHRSAISEDGNSLVQHIYEDPEVFLEKTDIEMRASALSGGVTGATIAAGFDMVLIDDE
jgi:hypothetical protein